MVWVLESLNENDTVDDDYRIEYHRNHIQEMKNAILEDGVDCLGYITWGPIDIPSSSCQIARDMVLYMLIELMKNY